MFPPQLASRELQLFVSPLDGLRSTTFQLRSLQRRVTCDLSLYVNYRDAGDSAWTKIRNTEDNNIIVKSN